jgi:antitoxin ParD1/3/4
MRTLTFSLSEDLNQFIDAQVASKGFSDASEYIGYLLLDALRQEGDPQLEALLLEGLASGDPIPVDENFWSELRKEAEQRVEARKAGVEARREVCFPACR